MVNPEDPITHLATDPDDNYQISSWGERHSDHSGTIAFGTPDRIIMPGGGAGTNGSILEPFVYRIPYYEFPAP
eukprot:UN34667